LYKRERELINLFKYNRLHSYFHLLETKGKIMKNKVDLFLDSGAFSAWSQGSYIDIQEYINFIKEHQDVISVYANLDVIRDPEATWKNQRIMEKAGLNPLPVFHYGEDIKWLKRYLNRGHKGIAIGGMVTKERSHLYDFLDGIFLNHICDSEGFPTVRVHGFGLTSLRLMFRYPWYSVDSTSWVVTGRMGSIYVPRFRGGEWIYDEDSWKIAVSSRSPNTKEAGKHIETLPPKQKQLVLDYIHSKGYQLGKSVFKTVPAGYELKENERWADKKPKDKTASRQVEVIEEPGVCNKYQLRDEMNIIYFQDLEQSMPEWPWPFKKKNKVQGLGL